MFYAEATKPCRVENDAKIVNNFTRFNHNRLKNVVVFFQTNRK